MKKIAPRSFYRWTHTPEGRAWLATLPRFDREKDCGHIDSAEVHCRRRKGHRGLHTWERRAVEHGIPEEKY